MAEDLIKLFYQDSVAYQNECQNRYNSEYTTRINLKINGNPAFFVQTPEVQSLVAEILRVDKAVSGICHELPPAAIDQFSRRCLVDEIVLTNSIEGVRSTRKEISAILDELEVKSRGRRFFDLVQKYTMLKTREKISLNTCEDIRNIYNELVLQEIAAEEKDNVPDGIYFRKGTVSIYSPAQKEIHQGVYPESAIIDGMEQALTFLSDDSCEILFRIGIFHYLLEYIHPFYDGNGRLGRFICSYLLSQHLEPVTGYRLSYTIKEHINEYYGAFTICNNPIQHGDLTPFLVMFLKIIKESVEKLLMSLSERFASLSRCYARLPEQIPEVKTDAKLNAVCDILIQAGLFSEIGVPTITVLEYANLTRETLNRKLSKIPVPLLIKVRHGKTNFFSVDTKRLLLK